MKISVVCAALFWISVLILGAASPLPVYFAAVSVIFFLRYGGRAVGKKPKIAYRGLAWLLPAAFAISASGSIYSRCSIAKLETFHREKAYRAGIPAARSNTVAAVAKCTQYPVSLSSRNHWAKSL